MISTLIDFANTLERDWSIEDHSQKALSFLSDLSINQTLEVFESSVAEWMGSCNLPKQVNLYNNFGEPSVSLFNNGKFAVDLYFWRKNDTIIHSHGFRGAFKLLYGLSLHEVFNVQTAEKFTSDIKRTSLESQKINILKPGDVHEITPELTHRVVHIDDPTVTLCVRTVEDTELEQWHHLPTGLSYKKKNLSEKLVKQVLYFQYLLNSDSLKAEQFIKNLLTGLDVSSQISLYESLCYGEVGLDESSFTVIEKEFKSIFESTNWFAMYKKYYESLGVKLQESLAENKELKFLAHAVNSNYSVEKTKDLLSLFTNKNLDELCKSLLENNNVFTNGFEETQRSKIENYLL